MPRGKRAFCEHGLVVQRCPPCQAERQRAFQRAYRMRVVEQATSELTRRLELALRAFDLMSSGAAPADVAHQARRLAQEARGEITRAEEAE